MPLSPLRSQSTIIESDCKATQLRNGSFHSIRVERASLRRYRKLIEINAS